MFKDVNIFVDKRKLNYTSKMENGKIKCVLEKPDDVLEEPLKIVYDENIYEIEVDKELNADYSSFGVVLIPNKIEEKEFFISLNYKYFIKTVYKFINSFIDIFGLSEELELFKESLASKKYKQSLENLIKEINEKPIEELMLEKDDERERISELLINSDAFRDFYEQMSYRDLMLIITAYLCVPNPWAIDQETFDKLILEAKNSEYAFENAWRLAVNYNDRGYNFDALDDFFVDSKNSWYLAEYISSADQVDQGKIIDAVIKTGDKDFMRELLKDNFVQVNLDEKYKSILEEALKD